jgi:hypothetical protein
LPNEKELAAARRVLVAIQNRVMVAQPDALVMRIWAGRSKALWPLDKIARELLSADMDSETSTNT